jgi:hypothetical protein
MIPCLVDRCATPYLTSNIQPLCEIILRDDQDLSEISLLLLSMKLASKTSRGQSLNAPLQSMYTHSSQTKIE